MQYPQPPLFVLVTVFGLLAGCGQKGPLFLPEDPATVTTPVPAGTGPQSPGDAAGDVADDDDT